MLLLKKNANFKERHLANGQIKSWRRLATLNNIIIIKQIFVIWLFLETLVLTF